MFHHSHKDPKHSWNNPMSQDEFNAFSKAETQDWSTSPSPEEFWASNDQSSFSSSHAYNTQALNKLHDIPLPQNMNWVSPNEPMIEIKELQGCALFVGILWTIPNILFVGISIAFVLIDPSHVTINGRTADGSFSDILEMIAIDFPFLMVGLWLILSGILPYIRPTYIHFNLQNQTIEIIKNLKKRHKAIVMDLNQVKVYIHHQRTKNSHEYTIYINSGEQKFEIFRSASIEDTQSYCKSFEDLINAARS